MLYVQKSVFVVNCVYVLFKKVYFHIVKSRERQRAFFHRSRSFLRIQSASPPTYSVRVRCSATSICDGIVCELLPVATAMAT